jgi:hypothetical protein
MECEYLNECKERGFGKCDGSDSKFCRIYRALNNRDIENARQRALERWQYEMNDIHLATVLEVRG